MSFFELIGELCAKIYDAEFADAPWNPNPVQLRRKVVQRLRSKCFEILLHRVPTPGAEADAGAEDEWWPAPMQVAGCALELHAAGRWIEAERVERITRRMLRTRIYDDPTACAVMELLLRLRRELALGDSVPHPEPQHRVRWGVRRVALGEDEEAEWEESRGRYALPWAPALAPPQWMLRLDMRESDSGGAFRYTCSFPFHLSPGRGLKVAGRFLNRRSRVPQYSIPDIPELTEPRGLTIPKFTHERWRGDEGYATSSNDCSRSASPEGLPPVPKSEASSEGERARARAEQLRHDDAVWARALLAEERRLRTWEALGDRLPAKEAPFATEAGQEYAKHFLQLTEGFKCVTSKVLTLEEFCRDLGHLLLGNPSRTFYFDEASLALGVTPGVRAEGLSAGAVAALSAPLVELATCVHRLQLLSERGPPGRPRSSPVMKALSEHVHEFLQFHWGASLLLGAGAPAPPPVRTKAEEAAARALLEPPSSLRWRAEPLRRRAVALARLLGVAPAPAGPGARGPFVLPPPAALLQHLCDALFSEARPDVACVVFSTLCAVAQAYFRFVERWVWEGVLADPWEEFFVRGGGDEGKGERGAGRRVWAQGYRVDDAAVPAFLRGLQKDVLACGKTVRLLRECCPKAALCVALQSGHPGVPCCVGAPSLRALARRCRHFEERVRALQRDAGAAGDSEDWRRLGPSHEEEARAAQMAEGARRAHALNAKLELAAGRAQKEERQRAWREELRAQAQENAARKEAEAARALEEHRLRAEAEQARAQREDELRRAERQRLMDYYEELSETAAKRQQRSEWRERRWALSDQREQLVLAESAAVRQAASMAQKNLNNALSMGTPLLPSQVALVAIQEDGAAAAADPGTTDYQLVDNLGTKDKESPNNNTIHNNIFNEEATQGRGDVNKNLLNNETKTAAIESERNLLDTTIEDIELGNVLLPLGHKPRTEPVDNASNMLPENNITTAGINTNVAEVHEQAQAQLPCRMRSDNGMPACEGAARAERPASVPLPGKDNVRRANAKAEAAQRAAQAKEAREVREAFETTAAQRRANRWNMLQGDVGLFTGDNPATDATSFFPVPSEPQCSLDTVQQEMQSEEKSRMGTLQPTAEQDAPTPPDELTVGEEIAEATESSSGEPMLIQETPSDADGPSTAPSGEPMVTQETPSEGDAPSVQTEDGDGLGMVGRMPKSLSSGSVGLAMGAAGGPWRGSITSSKASSCYTLASLTSSDLCTPSTDTDSTSLDHAFRSGNAQGDAGYAAFWRSNRLIGEPGTHSSEAKPFDMDDDDDNQSSSDEAASVEDIDFSSVLVALQKSVAIPLRTQLCLANEAVLKYFFEELHLLLHLESLRAFFLLSDGEFARGLTDALFSKMEAARAPSQVLNCMALNEVLRKALDAALHRPPEDPAQRLSFKVNGEGGGAWGGGLRTTEAVACLGLRYKAHWPLNLIITEEAVLKYDSAFNFMLRLRLAVWRLHQAFTRLKAAAAQAGPACAAASPQFHKVQLWRHEMTVFARAVQAYVGAAALQGPWRDFREALARVRTLDQLYTAHVTYVKRTLYRCLLYKHCAQLQRLLMGALNGALRFVAQLEASPWRCSHSTTRPKPLQHPDFERLRQLHTKFQQAAASFFRLIQKLVQVGYQTLLQELLESLSANGYYEASSASLAASSS